MTSLGAALRTLIEQQRTTTATKSTAAASPSAVATPPPPPTSGRLDASRSVDEAPAAATSGVQSSDIALVEPSAGAASSSQQLTKGRTDGARVPPAELPAWEQQLVEANARKTARDAEVALEHQAKRRRAERQSAASTVADKTKDFVARMQAGQISWAKKQ